MEKDQKIWFQEFYNRLYNQYLFLCDGGTTYRIETSRLSLEVAEQEKDIEPFLNRDQTTKKVLAYFPNLDEERLHDVSKMLYLNAKVVKGKNTRSNEMKQAIKERRKYRKPLRLLKSKKQKE